MWHFTVLEIRDAEKHGCGDDSMTSQIQVTTQISSNTVLFWERNEKEAEPSSRAV